jgi:aspartyl protease
VRRLALILLLAACDDGGGFAYQGAPGQPTDVLLGGWTPLIHATVGPSPSQLMLVDTGSPYTYVDPAVFTMGGGTATLGAFGLTFPDLRVRELDLGGVLGGLFGADILGNFVFVLDYQDSRAFLFDGVDAPVDVGADTQPPEPVDAPVFGSGRRVVVNAEIEGVEAKVLLDTGASYVTLDPAFLADLGGADRPELCCQTVLTATGQFDVSLTRLRSVKLDGVAEVQSVVAVPETENSTLLASLSHEVGEPLQALLGGTYLREFVSTVDYAGQRLWLERFTTEHHIDRREYIGPGFDVDRQLGNFVVVQVYQTSPADDAGVTPGGWQLIAIDQTFVSGMPLDDVERLLHGYDPGTSVPFRFVVDGNTRNVDLGIVDLLPDYR